MDIYQGETPGLEIPTSSKGFAREHLFFDSFSSTLLMIHLGPSASFSHYLTGSQAWESIFEGMNGLPTEDVFPLNLDQPSVEERNYVCLRRTFLEQ